MAEAFQCLKSFLKNDSLSGNDTSSSVLSFLEVFKQLFAFLFVFVCEKQDALSFEVLGNSVTVRLVAALFVSAKSDAHNFIFAHQELGICEWFSQGFEIVGGHVFVGQDVEVFEATQEGVDFVYYEFFVLSGLWLDLSQGN